MYFVLVLYVFTMYLLLHCEQYYSITAVHSAKYIAFSKIYLFHHCLCCFLMPKVESEKCSFLLMQWQKTFSHLHPGLILLLNFWCFQPSLNHFVGFWMFWNKFVCLFMLMTINMDCCLFVFLFCKQAAVLVQLNFTTLCSFYVCFCLKVCL